MIKRFLISVVLSLNLSLNLLRAVKKQRKLILIDSHHANLFRIQGRRKYAKWEQSCATNKILGSVKSKTAKTKGAQTVNQTHFRAKMRQTAF